MATSTCVNCPQGTFRTQDVQAVCEACPDPDFTTIGEGSVTVEECSVRDCPAGFEPGVDNCTACPIGKYKMSGISCISCGVNETTLAEGSTSEDDCIRKYNSCSAGALAPMSTVVLKECVCGFSAICPVGRQYDDVIRACIPCAIGQYKSENDATCQSCPINTRTIDVGSTSRDDCNFGKTKRP